MLNLEKERLLDHWCASMEIGKDFAKLGELLLLEEFTKCLSNEIKSY